MGELVQWSDLIAVSVVLCDSLIFFSYLESLVQFVKDIYITADVAVVTRYTREKSLCAMLCSSLSYTPNKQLFTISLV